MISCKESLMKGWRALPLQKRPRLIKALILWSARTAKLNSIQLLCQWQVMTSKKMSEGCKRLQPPLKILAMQCSPPPWFFIRTRVIIINNINIKIQTIVPITAFKSEFSPLNRAFSLTNPKSHPTWPASPTSCSLSFPRKLWMQRMPPCPSNSKSWQTSSRPQRFQIRRTRRQRQQRQRPWASTVSK